MKGSGLGLPSFLGQGLWFGVDALSLVFIFSACLVWLLSYFFSVPYMAYESEGHGIGSEDGTQAPPLSHHQGHPLGVGLFYVAFWGSLVSTLLVFLSRDLFTLFFFFELLTLFSFLLVLYEGKKESWQASGLYLFMSLLGGLLVLFATMILKAKTGSTEFSSLELLKGRDISGVAYLLLAGFGVKAGVFGLHVWLPRAHPVAPAPASAVLSGVMIKVGAYGILRVVLGLQGTEMAETVGMVLAFLGLANLFVGGFGAVFCNNLKKVLAYSSVSQMGYILMGISAIPHTHAAALALSGVLFHVIGHGLFKSLLFMEAGYFLMTRSTINLSELKGALTEKRDILGILGFICGFSAIVGFPGLSGFISKTLIHDGLLAISKHSLVWAFMEKAFLCGSFLTAVYFVRLSFILFFPTAWITGGTSPILFHPLRAKNAVLVRRVFLVATAALIWLGTAPGFWVKRVAVPALSSLAQVSPGVSHQVSNHLVDEAAHELENFSFFRFEFIKPILVGLAVGVFVNLALGKVLRQREGEKEDRLVDALNGFGKSIAEWTGGALESGTQGVYSGLCPIFSAAFIRSGWMMELLCQRGYQVLASSLKPLISFSGWIETKAGSVWNLLARLIGVGVPSVAGAVEEENHNALILAERGVNNLVDRINGEEEALSDSYDRMVLGAKKVAVTLSRLERLTDAEYKMGGRVFKDVVARGGKGALRFRPDFLLKASKENAASLHKASIGLIAVTVGLILGVAIVLSLM